MLISAQGGKHVCVMSRYIWFVPFWLGLLPIPSHTIPSHPIPSHPIPSHRIPARDRAIPAFVPFHPITISRRPRPTPPDLPVVPAVPAWFPRGSRAVTAPLSAARHESTPARLWDCPCRAESRSRAAERRHGSVRACRPANGSTFARLDRGAPRHTSQGGQNVTACSSLFYLCLIHIPYELPQRKYPLFYIELMTVLRSN